MTKNLKHTDKLSKREFQNLLNVLDKDGVESVFLPVDENGRVEVEYVPVEDGTYRAENADTRTPGPKINAIKLAPTNFNTVSDKALLFLRNNAQVMDWTADYYCDVGRSCPYTKHFQSEKGVEPLKAADEQDFLMDVRTNGLFIKTGDSEQPSGDAQRKGAAETLKQAWRNATHSSTGFLFLSGIMGGIYADDPRGILAAAVAAAVIIPSYYMYHKSGNRTHDFTADNHLLELKSKGNSPLDVLKKGLTSAFEKADAPQAPANDITSKKSVAEAKNTRGAHGMDASPLTFRAI